MVKSAGGLKILYFPDKELCGDFYRQGNLRLYEIPIQVIQQSKEYDFGV